jgi:hypothetical protein
VAFEPAQFLRTCTAIGPPVPVSGGVPCWRIRGPDRRKSENAVRLRQDASPPRPIATKEGISSNRRRSATTNCKPRNDFTPRSSLHQNRAASGASETVLGKRKERKTRERETEQGKPLASLPATPASLLGKGLTQRRQGAKKTAVAAPNGEPPGARSGRAVSSCPKYLCAFAPLREIPIRVPIAVLKSLHPTSNL